MDIRTDERVAPKDRPACEMPGCTVKRGNYRSRDGYWLCSKHIDTGQRRPDGHPGYVHIDLTESEADLWDWACDPIDEFWAEADERALDGDRNYEHGTAIIEVRRSGGGFLGLIANDPSVADDLIYRVETQMEHMAIEQGSKDENGRWDAERMKAIASIRTGRKLAGKIRLHFNMEGGRG